MSTPLSPNYRTKIVQSEVLTSDANTAANSCAQILTYYQALGFNSGDDCYINTYDAGVYQLRLGQNSIELWRCKKVEDGWKPTLQVANPVEYLRELGASGHNIQSYPNHLQGGLSNHHASQFTTCWYEIDDLPLEAQREKVRWLEEALGLRATIIVFSGGKSLHVYFTFDRPVDADTWTRLNRKLAIVAGGDPAICTLARAMRLPGMPRLKNEQIQEVAIESFTDTRHDPDEFEKKLDSTGYFPHGLSYERWLKWRKKRDYSVLSIPESEILPKPPSNFAPQLPYDGSTIPLEVCLSKDDRELVTAGAGEGNRDNAGYKLARNLIGTADQLQSLGINFAGDPRQLFEEYCSRCSPPLASRDIERIWRSASRGTPSASLPDEALQVCVAAYQRRQQSPYTRKAAGFITREKWLNHYKLPQAFDELAGTLKRLTRRSQRFLAALTSKKRTLSTDTPTPQITGGIVPYGVQVDDGTGKRTYRYSPGNLPTPERWAWLGRPEILFTPELAQQMASEAQEKGWAHIQDKSRTGSGKSHNWGQTSLGQLPGIDQIFYITGDAENPTTATVEENFERLVTRHDGQVFDRTHQTAMGKPHVRRAKAGSSPDIPGNCPETGTFLKLQEKGARFKSGKDSPICESCPLFASCGYISERRQQLDNEMFLRAHPDQMPDSFKQGRNVMGIWDEPGQTLTTYTSVRFSWQQLQQGLQKVQAADPHLYALLHTIFTKWYGALGEVKINQRYGLSFAEVRDILSLPRFIVGSGQTYDLLEIAAAADKLLNPQISLSGTQSPADKQSWIDAHWHPHYVSLLFRALTGVDERTSITIDANWNFTVSRPDRHYRRVARAMALNVWLDATLSTGDLALKIGARKDEILPTRMAAEGKQRDFPNLALQVVNRIGKCSQNREAGSPFAQQERLEKLIAETKRQILKANPTAKIGVIDFKKHAGAGAGYWFKDNRGSNEFKDCTHLILIGTPTPNLGAMAAEWQALTGETVEPTELTGRYGAWVHRQIRAEVIQGVGRLRAQLQPDRQKTCWLIGDGYGSEMISALQNAYPGCTTNIRAAADICLEAAPKGEQRLQWMVKTIFEAAKAGEKLTREKLADAIGVSVPRVKTLCKTLGGFNTIKQGIQNLVMALQGKVSPLELSEDARFIADQYLPDVAAQLEAGDPVDLIGELASVREAFGHRTYLAILAATPPATLSTFLKHIICALPPALLERIRLDDPIAA